MALNYIEYFLILTSAVTGFISISAFASLLGIPLGIMSSAIGFKIYAITARVKKYKAIIKKKKRKNVIKQFCYQELNSKEFLISTALIEIVMMNLF